MLSGVSWIEETEEQGWRAHRDCSAAPMRTLAIGLTPSSMLECFIVHRIAPYCVTSCK